MDPFHERLARLALEVAADYGFCLAGGYAVQAHGFVDRVSKDVDLFTTMASAVDFPAAQGTKNVPPQEARLWTGTKQEILQCFDGWANEVREVISLTPEASIVSVPAQDRSFLESWGDGPVTLVGDAAHPMLTSLSQGAGSAIEDGYALSYHLSHLSTEGDVVTVCADTSKRVVIALDGSFRRHDA